MTQPGEAREYCPGCEPDLDPSVDLVAPSYCDAHRPGRDGVHDQSVDNMHILIGSTEAGGEVNRVWCDMLHGRAK